MRWIEHVVVRNMVNARAAKFKSCCIMFADLDSCHERVTYRTVRRVHNIDVPSDREHFARSQSHHAMQRFMTPDDNDTCCDKGRRTAVLQDYNACLQAVLRSAKGDYKEYACTLLRHLRERSQSEHERLLNASLRKKMSLWNDYTNPVKRPMNS